LQIKETSAANNFTIEEKQMPEADSKNVPVNSKQPKSQVKLEEEDTLNTEYKGV